MEQKENELNPTFNLQDFVDHTEALLAAMENGQGNGLFIIHTANEWMELAQKMPVPKQLYKELWHSGEVCILFADTNTGKSILAVQIGNEIAQQEQEPVLYFDFELSAKQLEARYSNNYASHYHFSPNLKRIEIDPDMEVPEGMAFEEYLGACMERMNSRHRRQNTDHRQHHLPEAGDRAGKRRPAPDEAPKSPEK